jgi:hypothetical protein
MRYAAQFHTDRNFCKVILSIMIDTGVNGPTESRKLFDAVD